MKLKTLFISSLVVAGMMGTACGATTDNTVAEVTPVATLSATNEVGVTGTAVQVAPQGGETATPEMMETAVAPTDEAEAAGTAVQVAPQGGATATSETAVGTAVATIEPGLGAGTVEATDTTGMANMDTSTMRASTLMDYNVRNSQGEDLGDIEDLMVDVTNEQIRYVVLSFGGFLNIGDKLFAIPVSALRPDPQNNAVIFDVDQEALQNAPGFNPDNWPDTANPEWDVPLRDFWQDRMGAMPGSEDTTQNQTTAQSGTATPGSDVAQGNAVTAITVRASDLIGQNVQNAQADDLGEIEDLVVNLTNGQVEYAVLSFGGIADIGDRFYPIPLRALNFDQTDMVFRFDMNEDTLRNAPSFASDEWPNNLRPDMGEGARNFWDSELSMR